MTAETLPMIFLEVVKERPEKVALRNKEFGIWNEITWKDYRNNVEKVFHGLRLLATQKGDRIAVLSENRPEWMYIELAGQSAGALTVGLFVESLEKEIEYILHHAEVKIIICEDQEQTDKILNLKGKLPNLKHIITIDTRGMRNYRDPLLLSWDEWMEQSERERIRQPELFEQTIAQGSGDESAVILYTSGTTGQPKGVILSHKNIITISRGVHQSERMNDQDEVIAYLPMAWVGEKMFSLFFQLQAKYTVNFPEEMDMNIVLQNLLEIKPSILLFAPAVWERFASMIQLKIDNATFLKRLAFNTFMPIGERIAEKKLRMQKISFRERFLYLLGELLVFGWVRERIGLNYGRCVYTGGAAIGPEIFTYFHALGLELKQVYGQTEICGIAVIHPQGAVMPHTVGKPVPGVEVAMSENGEILFKSEGVFKEYFKNPESTAKTKKDGWLHTGDNGYFEEMGQLVVVDRAKDLFKTKNGIEFSPQLLENRLKFSPYIKNAVIIGNDREYVSALIQIDLDNVGNWAQRKKISYTTFKDLTQKQEVWNLIQKEIDRLNERLETHLTIQKFWLFPKELDPDDDEVTRTNKIKRNVIQERYFAEIDSLYN